MLIVSDRPVPQHELTYLAFRLAFLDTLERIALADQLQSDSNRQFGYLTEVPFLNGVPPQVQLDLLLNTWNQHTSFNWFVASLLQEAVLFAACESASRIVMADRQAAQRFLRNGPMPLTRTLDRTLSRDLRRLHLDLPNEGNFLLLSQFLDLPVDEATPLKTQFGITQEDTDAMLEPLARWHVAPGFLDWAHGLLTADELAKVISILRIPRPVSP